MRRRATIALVLTALVAALGLWLFRDVAADQPSAGAVDLSALFKPGQSETLEHGQFLDLRDPACTKAFSLRLTERAFVQMSRNCKYEMRVDAGRISVNFLNKAKGSVELAPGRSLVAADFWSINPVAENSIVRLDPSP
jgi:hypothetical protein